MSEDQKILSDLAYKVASERFAAAAYTWEARDEWPWENARTLADVGFLGLTLPEEVGGGGRPLLDGIIAMEQITRVCPHTADVVQSANFGAIRAVALFAQPELRSRVVGDVIAGRTSISLGMTEPEAGSALTDLTTRAVIEGNSVTINGAKAFCGHGNVSNYFVVYVRFQTGKVGTVLVERGTPGFTVGPARHYMSGGHYVDLFFDNCVVPASNIITTDFRTMMGAMNVERCGNAARCVGIAQAALDLVVPYVKTRKAFGRPISDFQAIQFKVADMYTRLEAARLLVYRAVANEDAGVTDAAESSSAKVFANEMAQFVTSEALQIFGAYGYSRELPLEYMYRRARGWAIAGGTVEMQRLRIAGRVLGLKLDQRLPKPATAAVTDGVA